MLKIQILCFLFFCSSFSLKESTISGEQLFSNNCSACHLRGSNIIIPEKNLRKETLEANGLNTIPALIYQVRNGKNGMPAFGGRLTEEEIRAIVDYVFKHF